MSSLYRKYRPGNFSQISGQEHIVKTLSRSIKNKRISHAYLFAGSQGTGKTTLARIFAKTVNCLNPNINESNLAVIEPCDICESCQKISSGKTIDIIEIDAASNTGVDNIRQLKENVNTPPAFLKYKVYIIDEVHMLSSGAFNALLKTLEEPPKHAIFILATTEKHKIPETIISRCQSFDFFKLSEKQIVDRLNQIAKKEKVAIEEDALSMIAVEAEGGMRDAESLLSQIISLENENITVEEIEKILGIASSKNLIQFVKNLFTLDNAKENLKQLEKMYQKGLNMKNFEKNLFFFLRELLIFKIDPDISSEKIFRTGQKQQEALREIAKNTTSNEIINLLDILGKNYSLHKNSPLPQLPLELSIIEFFLNKNNFINVTSTNSAKKLELEKSTLETSKIGNTTKKEIPILKTKEISRKKLPEKKETATNQNFVPISIKDFLAQWPKILEEAKLFNHSIHAFLKNCIPYSIENDKIIIKTRYEYHCIKLNQPECRLTVQSSIAKLFPSGLQVEFIFDKNLPVIENIPQKTVKKEAVSKENEEDLLFETMRDLGGRIVEEN